MAKTIVFHIGDPKTGTSSIQKALQERSFTSPLVTLDRPDQLNAYPLANALSDPGQAETRDKRFGDAAAWLAASPADIGVISAEMFYRVDPVVMQDAIAHYMPDHAKTARIVAYVRPHAQRFLSQFVQVSKTGQYWGDMQTLLDRVAKKDLLVYTPRFTAWRKVFGDRFTLRPMVRDALHNNDVVADFFKQVVGNLPFEVAPGTRVNESLPLEVLAGLRCAHATLNRLKVTNENRQSVGQYYVNRLNALSEGRGTKIRLSAAIYKQIADLYRADAEAMDKAFFGWPILQTALERDGQDTVPVMMSADAQSHFAPEAIFAIRHEAEHLAVLLDLQRSAWRKAFLRDIGQLPRNPAPGPRLPARTRHLNDIEALLGNIARIITQDFGKVAASVAAPVADQGQAHELQEPS